ncbi:MAG: PDZ domain-containing protein, partial [Gemmatimonadales bacterium]|nr:PDZ domain-containing protein [Gemmatimonadales bacterium]
LMRIMMNRRARLGIKVNLQARGTDSVGAYVDAVTPGGPAARAGLRSGDLITTVGGQPVLQPPKPRGRGREPDRGTSRQSLPGLRLIELAARLAPDDTVAVEFRRGKERKTAAVVTQGEPEFAMEGGPPSRPFALRFFRPDPSAAGPGQAVTDRFEIHSPGDFLPGSPLADLELTALNPQLGAYFGATDGVLVIRAPAESGLSLQGGDIVLAIDGRKPAGPTHLLRILRSYEPGEAFKIDVLRNHRRTALTGKVPVRP